MDIGSLTGQIAIEDQFSSTFEVVIRSVQNFAEEFNSSLGAVGVGVGIVTAGVVALTGAVTALAVKGSDVNDVTSTFENFADRVGGAEATLAALRGGVKGTVDDLALMKDASRLLSANVRLNAADFGTMAEAAFVLQNRGLGTTEQMLNMVSSAMMTGRTRTLAMTLGVVDAGDAIQTYAQKIGIARSELTQTQIAEARRIAVLGMLRSAVADAGTQELDFGERIERITARIANWWDELSSRVASSTNVARAFDMVDSAIERLTGGSSRMDTIISWVNRFADAVAEYGPPIVDTLVRVRDWISSVWQAVTNAWNAVPDWFKNIARDAAIAAAGLYLTSKAVDSVIARLPMAQKNTESFMTSMNDYATVTDAAISVSRLFVDVGINKIRDGMKTVGTTFTAAREGVNNLGVAFKFAEGLGGSLFSQVATGAVVMASATAVVTAAYQAWQLWSERQEQAADAAVNAEVNARNLVILNQKMGTSYTEIADAVKEWGRRSLEAKPPVVELTEQQRLAAEIAKAHKDKVDALVGSLVAASNSVNLTTEAFNQLTIAQRITRGAQEALIPLLDKKIEQGYKLTAAEQSYYEQVIVSRLNLERQATEILRTNKVTIERIEVMKSWGMSETEIAAKLGTTVAGLKSYQTEMMSLRALTQEVADLQLEWAGRSAEAIENARQREFEAALRSFNGTSVEFDNFAAKLKEKYELLELVGTRSWQSVADISISSQQRQLREAERVLVHMQMSGNFFRADIEKQRAVVDNLKESLRNMGETGEEAFTSMSAASGGLISSLQQTAQTTVTSGGQMTHVFDDLQNAMMAANTGIDATTIKVRMLDGSVLSLAEAIKKFNVQTSMTYDLSTEEGMAHFKKLNPSASVNVGTEYFKEHTLQQAIQAGLIDLYAGFHKGIMRTTGAYGLNNITPEMMVSSATPWSPNPEVVQGGASVGHGTLESKGITIINHINGTPEETANKISEIIVKKALFGRPIMRAGGGWAGGG